MPPPHQNYRYVAVHVGVAETLLLPEVAKLIQDQFGCLTRAVYLSCHERSPTAPITLARLLSGYNKMLLEGCGDTRDEEDFRMLVSAETGLILASPSSLYGQAAARLRNKPESTWHLNEKKEWVRGGNAAHEPRNSATRSRVSSSAVDVGPPAIAPLL